MEKNSKTETTNRVNKIERAAYILVVLFLSLSLIREAVFSTKYEKTANSLQLENSKLVKETLEDSSTIYSMQVKLAEASEIQETQRKTIDLLKIRKPEEIVRWKTQFKYKTSIDLGEPEKKDSISRLVLPKRFEKYEQWFTINGEIDTKGRLNIDSLITYAEFTYAVGDTLRDGFVNKLLNRKDKVIRLHIDNPNMVITGMDNIYLRDCKKWYQTAVFKFAVGFVAGTAFQAVVK